MFVLANVLQPLIDIFEGILQFFHDTVGLGWGMSIVALTVVVRAALIPLTLRQYKSMRKLQELSPEIKKLQAKYKDDRQRLNQEMMKFYQENKVNPLGSCLPLVAQLPVFLGLFYMLQKDLKLDICGPALEKVGKATGDKLKEAACADPDVAAFATGAPEKFLFIPDLTNNATGSVLIILIVLYIGSQLASSLLMATSMDRNQKLLILGLPFVFTIFILNFPAGLIVYWITTNLWTIVQQFIVRRTLGPPPKMEPTEKGEGLFAQLKGAAQGTAPQPAAAAAGGGGSLSGAKPPPPPRKKKKRSGRRR